MSSRDRTVILWGATSVGKSTALAAYFGKYQPTWVDREDLESTRTVAELRAAWFVLQSNQLASGTSAARDYKFKDRKGMGVVFRDMVGGVSHRPNAREDLEALDAATGMLLFVDVTRTDAVNVQLAVDNALAEWDASRPKALVLTKCEALLTQEEFGYFAAAPHRYPDVPALKQRLSGRLLEQFRDHPVFPITVYGWHEGMPAQYLDEFGRLVPFRIDPSLVDCPFEYALEQRPV